MQKDCVAARMAFSYPAVDTAAAQTHGLPAYVTDHAGGSAVIVDSRASGGNAAKLEEPDQNQPVPPGAYGRGELAWDRSREVPGFHCLPQGQTWPLCCCYLSAELRRCSQ